MNRPAVGQQTDWLTLEDVGPLQRRRSHPAARALVNPVFLVPVVPVVLLVLIPVASTVLEALKPGGFRSSDQEEWVWSRDGIGDAWLRSTVWVGLCFLVTGLALTLAHAGRRLPDKTPGSLSAGLLRLAAILPAAVPLVVTAVTFRLLYDPDPERGLITRAGAPFTDITWLAPGWPLTAALMFAFAWMWLGYATVVLGDAVRRVPPELEVVAGLSRRRWASRAAVVFRDAYWAPLLRRVSVVAFLPLLVMTGRMLELALITSPDPAVDDIKVFAVLHWEMAAGEMTPASAALGIVWWALMVAAVWFVVALARPSWAPLEEARHDQARQDEVRRDKARRDEARQDKARQDRRDGAASTARPGAAAAADDETPKPASRPLLSRLIAVVSAGLVAGFWLLPLGVLALTSVTPSHVAALEGLKWGTFDLDSYRDLGGWGYWSSFRLTAGVALLAAAAATAVAIVLASAIDDMSSRGARTVVRVLVVAAVVPVQVIAGPLHAVFDSLHSLPLVGVPDGVRLTLAHIALTIPLGVVVLHVAGSSAAVTIDETWRESDARRVGALRETAKKVWDEEPAVVAVFVLIFLLVWNDFAVGLLFAGRSTLPLGVFLFGETRQFVTNSAALAAGAMVMAAVPLALLAATHRKVIRGLVGTAGPVRT